MSAFTSGCFFWHRYHRIVLEGKQKTGSFDSIVHNRHDLYDFGGFICDGKKNTVILIPHTPLCVIESVQSCQMDISNDLDINVAYMRRNNH